MMTVNKAREIQQDMIARQICDTQTGDEPLIQELANAYLAMDRLANMLLAAAMTGWSVATVLLVTAYCLSR